MNLWFVVNTCSAQGQWKSLIVARDNNVSFADCCQQCPGTWAPLKSGGNHQRYLHVPLVQTQLLLLLLLQWTTLFVVCCNHVNVASFNDNTKIFDQCICCDGSHRKTIFITGAMVLVWGWWRIVAQLLFEPKGLSLPCTMYAALMRLIVTGQDVHGQLPLWRGAHCCSQPSCHSWQGVRCCLLW